MATAGVLAPHSSGWGMNDPCSLGSKRLRVEGMHLADLVDDKMQQVRLLGQGGKQARPAPLAWCLTRASGLPGALHALKRACMTWRGRHPPSGCTETAPRPFARHLTPSQDQAPLPASPNVIKAGK